MLHGISAYIKYVIAGLIFSAMMAGVAWIINLFKKKKKQQAAAPQAGQAGQMVAGAGSEDLALLVKEADNKLAQAKLGNMANLPVFLLVGDSGTTKSTVMVQSGIDPDLLAGQVYQNTDVVPTRTANLWFARNALFLEAAGSLPHDPAAW